MHFLHLDAGNSWIPKRKHRPSPCCKLDPEREVGKRQVREVLEREIRRIPALLRNVVLLRDVAELPIAEVADRLGITVSAAKSRLLRARLELRQRVLRHCGPSGQGRVATRITRFERPRLATHG